MQVSEETIATACESLYRLFSSNREQLVKQALDIDLVNFLLNLLENRMEYVENPSKVKAQIVKALKAMSRSLSYGDRVNVELEKSTIWSQFKDQRHDLFISSTPNAGYLTGKRSAKVKMLTSDVIVWFFFGRCHSYKCRLLNRRSKHQ